MRVFTFVAREEDEGRSVASVLRCDLHLSNGLIRRLKFQGGLFLDGESVRTDVRVKKGQQLEVRLVDSQAVWEASELSDELPDIRYEDEDILIVNKPAPLPAIASAKQQGDTLEGRMHRYFEHEENYIYRPVNRLDKGTSGLMVVAKNSFAQDRLQKDLHSEHFVRRYLAVCEGTLPMPEGVIDDPIARERWNSVRRVIREDGKQAVTHYRVLRENKMRSLVSLQLETGRTHQIRVHMASRGCPLVGDYIYGQECAALPGRFALHACFVRIRHPVTGSVIEIEEQLPQELEKLL